MSVHEDVNEFDGQMKSILMELELVGDVPRPVDQLASLAQLWGSSPDSQDGRFLSRADIS